MEPYLTPVPGGDKISAEEAHAAAAEVPDTGFLGTLKTGEEIVLAFAEDPGSAVVQSVKDAVAAWTAQGKKVAKPRILSLIPETVNSAFSEVDYIRGLTLRLAPRNEFSGGVLIKTTLYERSYLDPDTGEEMFENAIVEETFDYTRDSGGFALQRTMGIRWFNDDGSYNAFTKTRSKVYDLTERIRETDRRRSNVMDHIKTKVLGLLVAVNGLSQGDAVDQGQSLFSKYQVEISRYLQAGDSGPIIAAISTDTEHAWLDTALGPSATTRLVILGDLQ